MKNVFTIKKLEWIKGTFDPNNLGADPLNGFVQYNMKINEDPIELNICTYQLEETVYVAKSIQDAKDFAQFDFEIRVHDSLDLVGEK